MVPMLVRRTIELTLVAFVVFAEGCNGGQSKGTHCAPGANIECNCAPDQTGIQTCTDRGTFSACVCGGQTSDAGGPGGAVGGASAVGRTGGTGGATIPPASNGDASTDASLPTDADASVGDSANDVPLPSDASSGGKGGSSIPASSTGGMGGIDVIGSSSAGGGGMTAPIPSTGGAGGTTTLVICGNLKIEAGEGCDDGNQIPFDGCSSDCQIEPDCSGSSCKSACGDGIILGGEECDDANHASGDGCSADCKVEPGWICAQPALGNKIMVPAIYRDFRAHNPVDFESGRLGTLAIVSGLVNPTLGADGKPVYSGSSPLITSQETFAEWYRDVPGVNHATTSKMTLWNNGKGGYVNRYGPNGEQWNMTERAYFCGYVGRELVDAAGTPIPCTWKDEATQPTDCTTKLAAGEELLTCSISDNVYQATFIVSKVDGNPVFFPVDDDTFTPAAEKMAAQIPPYYDPTSSWPYDQDAAGNRRQHNFSFTSEIRSWFLYDKSTTYSLELIGDDDVWVFIGGKLALDLGGLHPPATGSIVIGPDGNGTTATVSTYPNPSASPAQGSVALGLQDGRLYEIAVFQAERQSTGSSFKLTLTGFNRAPSQCAPK